MLLLDWIHDAAVGAVQAVVVSRSDYDETSDWLKTFFISADLLSTSYG